MSHIDSMDDYLVGEAPLHRLGSPKNLLDFEHAFRVLEFLFPDLGTHVGYAVNRPGNLKVSKAVGARALYSVWLSDPENLRPVFLRFASVQEAWEMLQAEGLLPTFALPWLFPWTESIRSTWRGDSRDFPYPESLLDLLSIALYTPQALRTMEELFRTACSVGLTPARKLAEAPPVWRVFAPVQRSSLRDSPALWDLRALGFAAGFNWFAAHNVELASHVPEVLSFSFPAGFTPQ